jgi:hypothetical protein
MRNHCLLRSGVTLAATLREDLLRAESRRPQRGGGLTSEGASLSVLKAEAKPERVATKKGRCS